MRVAPAWRMDLGKKMAPANDIKAAKATYSGFVNMVKWATPAICALVFVVILVIQ